jgi:hypothetical protein
LNANDLLASSLRLLGVLASGETPSGAEATDGLMILNQMLDMWNAEHLNIFTVTIATYPLVAGQQTYTLGVGGNFNAVRPAKIASMSSLTFNNPSQPLELPLDMLSDSEWQAIPVKAIQSTYPTKVYDDGAYPLRSLNFWPIPSAVCSVLVYGWTALTSFSDLVTDITFPPGYLMAIRYNLAAYLAPEFGRQLPPEVAVIAMQSKAVIQSMNIVTPISFVDDALVPKGGIYDWRTDQYTGSR